MDGTNNYLRNNPNFSVSIAFKRNKEVLLGVVYVPVFDELYFALKGHGAFIECNKDVKSISVSGEISKKMFTFSFASGIDFYNSKICDNIVNDIRKSGLFSNFRRRMLESTAYELCCVAKGNFDAHFNNFVQPWDVAAGEIIVNEAGGMFSYIKIKSEKVPIILASNGIFHERLLKIIEYCLK